MAQLAIKGHKTRGGEIIKILEMLGANNTYHLKGNENYAYYVKERGEIRVGDIIFGNEPYIIFTLEEFLKKFPYKVGDSVSSKYLKNYKIEKAEWVSRGNRVIYKLQGVGWHSVEDLQPYKEETMKEEGETFGECIEKTIDICLFGKKETIDRKYNVEEYLKVWKETDKGLEVVVNDRFELKEDNGKFYLIKKQIHYPATIEECANLLNTLPHTRNGVSGYSSHTLWKLQQLLICRDAYWKIAGEQIGLGKPWEPNWEDETEIYYTISYNGVNIKCYNNTDVYSKLAFPTAEMQDAFYKNFKDLIEECKEFL